MCVGAFVGVVLKTHNIVAMLKKIVVMSAVSVCVFVRHYVLHYLFVL